MRISALRLAACILCACVDEGRGGSLARVPEASAPAGPDAAGWPSATRADAMSTAGLADSALPLLRDAARGEDGSADVRDADTLPPFPTTASRYFPVGAFMYQPVASAAVDPDSASITGWLQEHGKFGTGVLRIDFSIEVLTASEGTPKRAFEPTADFHERHCDRVPFPLPAGGALEGESGYGCAHDGDCHLIVVDRAAARLYEMWRANLTGEHFYGGCAAVWDMSRVYGAEGRGAQCSSADAAGLPIAPLLFSADEVFAGSIDHAIRFILPNTRMRAGTYQAPGTHAGAPSGPVDAPIYGSRFRLRADFDLTRLPNEGARVVARALQKYGMVLADGGNIALTAQSDRFTTHKWEGLLGTRDLALLEPKDFEVVQTGEPIALTRECQRAP